MADLRRIRMLEEALAAQSVRTSEHGEGTPLRLASERLIAAARVSGDYVNPSAFASFGELKRRQSGESAVYYDSSRAMFVKVKNPAAKCAIKRNSSGDWPFEHIVHNLLFPRSRYEFLGVSEERGEARIVLEQKAVESETRASAAQVAAHMAALGLIREDRFFFGCPLLAVTDVGQGGDNALVVDDGSLAFIDPLIRLKKPAREIVAALIAD